MPAARRRESVVCTWCQHPMPVGKIRYWGGKPQCIDVFRCTDRIPRKTNS
ncbi:hypothetical protein [Streptomyces sp. NPDC056190]